MSFEKPEYAENVEAKGLRKGLALKSLIAITNGVFNREASLEKEHGFLISAIEKTRSTYNSLDSLEKEIDPTGTLSSEIEERLVSGIGQLVRWLEEPLDKEKGHQG